MLKNAADIIDSIPQGVPADDVPPVVSKIDVTRDLGGCFFAKDDFKRQYKELQQALNEEFDTIFKDSGNSFDSNFQYVDQDRNASLKVRIKYYWKNLSMM